MAISPPRPKGPHLNALRAFESAARLGSFVAAAEELSVTPGAIVLSTHAEGALPDMPVTGFTLYQSTLCLEGARHDALAHYALR